MASSANQIEFVAWLHTIGMVLQSSACHLFATTNSKCRIDWRRSHTFSVLWSNSRLQYSGSAEIFSYHKDIAGWIVWARLHVGMGTSESNPSAVLFLTSISNASAHCTVCSENVVVVSSRSSIAIHSTVGASFAPWHGQFFCSFNRIDLFALKILSSIERRSEMYLDKRG